MTLEMKWEELATRVQHLAEEDVEELLRLARELGERQNLDDEPRDEWERLLRTAASPAGVALSTDARRGPGLSAIFHKFA